MTFVLLSGNVSPFDKDPHLEPFHVRCGSGHALQPMRIHNSEYYLPSLREVKHDLQKDEDLLVLLEEAHHLVLIGPSSHGLVVHLLLQQK